MNWDAISKAIDKKEREEPAMDIYSKPGTKVIFKYPNSGREYDRKWAKEVLTLKKEYTVREIIVGRSSSLVEFKEFPELQFNTVHFANVEEENK